MNSDENKFQEVRYAHKISGFKVKVAKYTSFSQASTLRASSGILAWLKKSDMAIYNFTLTYAVFIAHYYN